MVHYAIVNMKGEVDGQYCKIGATSKKSDYDALVPPEGRLKVLLSVEDYGKLLESYDPERKIHISKIDLIELRVIDLTEAEIKILLKTKKGT